MDNVQQNLGSPLPIDRSKEAVEVKIPLTGKAELPSQPAVPEALVEPMVNPEPKPVMPQSESASLPPEPFMAPPVEPKSWLDKIKKALIYLLIVVLLIGMGYFLYTKISRRIGRQEAVNLTYWGLWEPDEVINGILQDWEKDHPGIKIDYVFQSPNEYRERLQSALARNEGPDIFRFHISWVPMLKNELEPMPASVMSLSQFENDYYPVVANGLKSGSSVLGVPLMVDSLALFYNQDIFQAAGKNPPTSWDELRQTAADLTVKDESGQIQIAGVALGMTGNVDHWSDILGLMMLQNNADLSRPGECYVQNEDQICLGPDALTFYTLFSRVDQVWDETMPPSTMAFAAGKTAMYFGPSWRIFDLQVLNPELNFAVAPVPQLPDTNINWATFWVEGVAKKSGHTQEAWQFLKYLSSDKVVEKLYQIQSNTRLFGELYPRVDMGSKLQDNPLLAPFIQAMPQAQSWYLSSNTFDNGINDKIIKYYEDAVNAVNSGTDAQKALETTNQGVAQVLSQYGIASSVVR